MISTIRQALQQGQQSLARRQFGRKYQRILRKKSTGPIWSKNRLQRKRTQHGRCNHGKIQRYFGATDTLQRDEKQLDSANQFIKSTTEENSRETAKISEENVKHLVQQSELLQSIVDIFKISRK